MSHKYYRSPPAILIAYLNNMLSLYWTEYMVQTGLPNHSRISKHWDYFWFGLGVGIHLGSIRVDREGCPGVRHEPHKHCRFDPIIRGHKPCHDHKTLGSRYHSCSILSIRSDSGWDQGHTRTVPNRHDWPEKIEAAFKIPPPPECVRQCSCDRRSVV